MTCSPSSSFPTKLSNLAESISKWATKNVGSLAKKIKMLSLQIDDIRENATTAAQSKCLGTLEAKLEKLLLKEEIYWKQRSRVNWLSEGDRNMAYFHKSASACKKRNLIHRLRKADNSFTPN